MIGAICRADILAHPFVTIHCFGWQVFCRALSANHDQTFLSLLTDTKGLKPVSAEVSEFVERCIKLELQAKEIYERLTAWFFGHKSVSSFFETLAHQEESHARLLELCRVIANRTIWKEDCFAPCRKSIPPLERQMENIESSLESIDSIADALRLVIEIENSGVNQVFKSVVAASGSDFVRKLLVFQNAAEDHIAYICDEIPKLEPDLAKECRELRERFFVCTG
ncbi:MAG: hypothetical protein ACYC6Y_03880 [Thermoguttaceae bacterium]